MQENWVDRLVKQDYFSTVRRFTVAALLGVSSIVGSGAFILMGVIAPAISAGQHHFEKKRKQKLLLNFYQDELSTVLHKKPEALTLEDLEKVKSFAAISEPLKEYDITQKQRVGIAIVSSFLTVAALLGAESFAGPALPSMMPHILQLGLVTAGYMAIRHTVSATAAALFNHEEATRCVSEKLMDLADHIKEKPVNAVQVFSIFNEADPLLQADVKARFGKSFEQLSAIRKKEVVEAYEPSMRIIALTDALNRDEIKASLVGFLAYHQAEGLPENGKYKALFSQPLAKVVEVEAGLYPEKKIDFAKRIVAEREDILPGRILN